MPFETISGGNIYVSLKITINLQEAKEKLMKIFFEQQEVVEVKQNESMWYVKKQDIVDFLEKESNTSKISYIERCVSIVYLPLVKTIDIINGKGTIMIEKKRIKMEISEELLKFIISKKS